LHRTRRRKSEGAALRRKTEALAGRRRRGGERIAGQRSGGIRHHA